MQVNAKRSIIIIAIASLLVGGVAVWLSAQYIQGRVSGMQEELESKYDLMPVIAAGPTMEQGAKITRQNLIVKELPRKFIPSQALHPRQLEKIQGANLVVDVEAGQPILSNYVSRGIISQGTFSGQITDGMRAVTFPVDVVSSVGGLLNPGDNIDLMATMRMQNQEGIVTLPLLDNLDILAVGEVYQGANDRRYQHITLEVSPKDAARLLQARQQGSLTAVLRSPEDSDSGFDSAMTASALFDGPFSKYFSQPEPTPAPILPPQPTTPRVEPPRNIDLIIGGTGQ
ncbi:Flp pilus assembly protein CpaB [Marinobacter confluentis]|uniref:Flp pilus assembly protein CpaB n=1 Tax=Marinobacter confluentis TaxID=1697557 RepID=A0A4Z1CJK9_9GAMM|nr:Flp pilus assembly protein CpaB [Marinobacter confluentis]TGN41862.1 Flp pilus assembly protein CpaB [Marinobacter confluentis]